MVDPEEMKLQLTKIELIKGIIAIGAIALAVLFTILTRIW